MEEAIFLIMLIFFLAVLLAFAFGILNMTRREKFNPDYYVMFIIGICWLMLGIIFQYNFVIIVGICLSLFGIIKKQEWKQ